MKKTISLSVFIFILFACFNSTWAQVYVPAFYPETPLAPAALVEHNSAMIDYTPNCTATGGCGISQLKATTWSFLNNLFNSSPGGVIVDDGVGPSTTIMLVDSTISTIDVVIGNNIQHPSDYLLGIVYGVWPTATSVGGFITLDIYDISNVGTGLPLFANLVSHQTWDTSASVDPRIDIIAEYNNAFLGLPRCDKFVISYMDTGLSLDGGNVAAYYSSLNNPTTFTKKIITYGTRYIGPDVAAIQRYGPDGVAVDDVALFTFLDSSIGGSGSHTTYLYYQEWDITQNTISSPVLLDTAKQDESLDAYNSRARIDAIDDYHINSPTISHPLAYYSVTWLAADTDYYRVKAYNNLLLIPGGLDVSSPYLGNTDVLGNPVIAAGPCNNYTIGYPQYALSSGTMFSQNIDWSTGYPVGYNGSLTNPFTNVDYYQVNYSYPEATSAFNACSVSATCNGTSPNYAPYAFFTFNDSDGVANYDTYEKVIDCTMNFKTASVPKVVAGQWSLSPNPAVDIVVLANDNATQDNTYGITDITGRTMLHANVTSGKQQIDVSTLAPGMYLLNVYSGGGNVVKTMKFVKE